MRLWRKHGAVGLVVALLGWATALPAEAEDYTVGPGDVLNITVQAEPQASGVVTVGPDGQIALPLIGAARVGGLTLQQITEKLTDAFKKFDEKPQVVVSIRQAVPRQFVYLVGQVAKPGSYEMQKGWTVAELLAVSGGPTPMAALSQALILRKDTTIPVDLSQLLSQRNTAANASLQPGDVLMIPETKDRVQVLGAVDKPGPYTFKAGDRLVDALSMAGGTKSEAALKDIGVIRQESPAKPAVVVHADLTKFYRNADMNQNIVLLPGDVVYVPNTVQVDWLRIIGTLIGIGLFLH